MAKCDLCRRTVATCDLRELQPDYQLPDVKDLCMACIRWVEKQLDDIRAARAPELRRRIASRVGKGEVEGGGTRKERRKP